MKDLFYKPIRISSKDDNIFFWSDLHLGQECKSWSEPLYKKRGFSSLEEHDNTIVSRWNNKISSDSFVFNLGDMLFGYNGEERLISYFNKLNFKEMYLLFGNHHAGMKQVFNSIEGNIYEVNSEKRVIFCPPYIESYLNGTFCVMSHYPVASFNSQGKGSFMIHGHCHSNLYKSEIGKVLYKARIVDVGVENHPEPVSLGELKKKFTKDPVSFDHHDTNS